MVGLSQQVDELVSSVISLQRARGGRLVAVTLAVPPAWRADEVVREVVARLDHRAHLHAEVTSTPTLGPLRVMAVEFER